MDWPRMRAVLDADVEQHEQISRTEAVPVGTAKPEPVNAQVPSPPATPPAPWPTWKIPLAFAVGGVILWALVTGKINSEDAQRLFKQLVQ